MERPRWPYATKLTVSLLLLAFFVYLLSRFHEIIAPMIIAIIVAYILNPVINFLQTRLRVPRVLGIVLTYLVILAIIIGVPILVITIMGENIEPLQINPQKFMTTIESALAQEYTIAGITIHPSVFAGQVFTALQGLVQPVVGQTVTLIRNVITSLFWMVLIVMVSIYLLKDSSRLDEWFTSHVPGSFLPDYRWIRDEINQIWSAFFRGQILLSALVTAIFIAVGFIIGLPFALGMGFLAGILEFLPSIGHGIWLVSAALLAFFLGSTWIPMPHWTFALIVVVLHLIFEQIDINLLIPRIVGRRVRLPALVVILGIVAGAILAGVLGIPLAAPTIASMRVLGRYIFANLLDLEWKPVSTTQPLPPPNPYWWQRIQRREKLS